MNSKVYSKNLRKDLAIWRCQLQDGSCAKTNENIKSKSKPEELVKDERSHWGKQTIQGSWWSKSPNKLKG